MAVEGISDDCTLEFQDELLAAEIDVDDKRDLAFREGHVRKFRNAQIRFNRAAERAAGFSDDDGDGALIRISIPRADDCGPIRAGRAGHGHGEFAEVGDLDLPVKVVSIDGAPDFDGHLFAAEVKTEDKGKLAFRESDIREFHYPRQIRLQRSTIRAAGLGDDDGEGSLVRLAFPCADGAFCHSYTRHERHGERGDNRDYKFHFLLLRRSIR